MFSGGVKQTAVYSFLFLFSVPLRAHSSVLAWIWHMSAGVRDSLPSISPSSFGVMGGRSQGEARQPGRSWLTSQLP